MDVGEVVDICMRHRLGHGSDSLRIVTRSRVNRSGALCTCSNTRRQPPLAGEFPLRSKGVMCKARRSQDLQVVSTKPDQTHLRIRDPTYWAAIRGIVEGTRMTAQMQFKRSSWAMQCGRRTEFRGRNIYTSAYGRLLGWAARGCRACSRTDGSTLISEREQPTNTRALQARKVDRRVFM